MTDTPDAADQACRNCEGDGWVCENHLDRPWDGINSGDDACHCGGAGSPCPVCRFSMAAAGLSEQLAHAKADADRLAEAARYALDEWDDESERGLIAFALRKALSQHNGE